MNEDELEIGEYLTSRRNGKTIGYVYTNKGFFNINDATIVDGKLIVGTMYGDKK